MTDEEWLNYISGPETPASTQRYQPDLVKGRIIGYGAGLLKPVAKTTHLLEKSAAALGVPGAEAMAQEQAARMERRQALEDPISTPIGEFITGLLPLTTATKLGAVTGGGTFGAVSAVDPQSQDYWGQVGTGAKWGAGLGLGTYGLGNVLSPRIDPEAALLMQKGVDVPAHQATTGLTKSYLGLADTAKRLITGAPDKAPTMLQMNTALINDVLEPLGKKVTGDFSPAQMKEFQELVSNNYNDAYKALGTVLPSKSFVADVRGVQGTYAQTMNKATRQKLSDIVDNNIIRRFNVQTKNQGNAITGQNLKEMRDYFSDAYEQLKNTQFHADVDTKQLFLAVNDIRKAVNKFTDDVDPTGKIRTANTAFAEAKVIEKAAASDLKTQHFTVEEIESAIKESSATSKMAVGEGRLQQKFKPYLDILHADEASTWQFARKVAIAATALGGSAYAYADNPAAVLGILAAAGIGPKAFAVMLKNQNAFTKGLGAAIKKVGPQVAGELAGKHIEEKYKEARPIFDILEKPFQRIDTR